jgi:hypothetical protein
MADIRTLPDQAALIDDLRAMEDSHLLAQNLVQQGAIHAVSFLLANGCSEEMATDMLASLRSNATAIRAEAKRRGKLELFPEDQTVSN